MPMLTGQVSGMQQRFEQDRNTNRPITIWSFRLERQDAQGAPLPRVAVEMRGEHFDGAIEPGDWVRVEEEWQPGTTLRTQHVTNLSSNTTITAKGVGSTRSAKLVGVLFGLFFVAVLAWVVFGFLQNR
jgi:hypothetical protein